MTYHNKNSLIEPWRGLPRSMTYYAIAGVVLAIGLMALHVAFPPPLHLNRDRTHEPTSDRPESIPIEQTGGQNISWFMPLPVDDALNRQLADFWHKVMPSKSDPRHPPDDGMMLADSSNDPGVVAELINKSREKPRLIDQFLEERGLTDKYTAGIAIFYSDGTTTIGYAHDGDKDIYIDLSSVKMDIYAGRACIKTLKVFSPRGLIIDVKDDCFLGNGTFHYLNVNGLQVDVIQLAHTRQGTAWALGLRRKN